MGIIKSETDKKCGNDCYLTECKYFKNMFEGDM